MCLVKKKCNKIPAVEKVCLFQRDDGQAPWTVGIGRCHLQFHVPNKTFYRVDIQLCHKRWIRHSLCSWTLRSVIPCTSRRTRNLCNNNVKIRNHQEKKKQRYSQNDFDFSITNHSYRKVPRRRQARRLFRTEIHFALDEPGQGQQQNRRNSIPKQRLFVYPQSVMSPVSIWINIINIQSIKNIVFMCVCVCNLIS